MPANILNLAEYRVLRVEETDHDYHITAEPALETRQCGHCGSSSFQPWGGAEQPRLIKDLPMHGKRVGIYVDPKRFRCQSCGKTFFALLPAVADKRQMTERLVNWIGRQSLKRTFLSLADETGVDEKTIRNIFRDYINELEKQVRFETPKWMGIDEIHLIKPRCVISNIQNNTIVDMLPNRNKDTVSKYLFQMDGKDRIQYVAMDMWTPYRDAVESVLPDARIVIDKFHVVRMANDAMERTRKALRADLSTKQRRGLMHDRFVLLKRERDLDDKERLNLDGWTKNYPTLGNAYRLKEDFYGIYDAKSPEEAMERYEAWYRAISPDIREHFSDIIRAWGNWQPYILGYFEHPVTNAYTESLNNLVRCLSRLGRGYSFEALRAKILFTEGVHAHKQKRPKFEKKAQPEKVLLALPELAEEPKFDRGVGLARYTTLNKGFRLPELPKPPQEDQQDAEKTEKNYGADISTLIRLIESGEL